MAALNLLMCKISKLNDLMNRVKKPEVYLKKYLERVCRIQGWSHCLSVDFSKYRLKSFDQVVEPKF